MRNRTGSCLRHVEAGAVPRGSGSTPPECSRMCAPASAALPRPGMPGTDTPSSFLQDGDFDRKTTRGAPYALPPWPEGRGFRPGGFVNTEERQLAEMLHRVTPEPPRRVTVEDVAFRLAAEAGRGGPGRGHAARREPRARRGFSGGRRGWAPALAALAVFAVAGTSAGIATVMTSHSHAILPKDGTPSSPAVSGSPSSTPPTQPPASTNRPLPPVRIAGGIWGAELINRRSFDQVGLTADAGSLYAVTGNALV